MSSFSFCSDNGVAGILPNRYEYSSSSSRAQSSAQMPRSKLIISLQKMSLFVEKYAQLQATCLKMSVYWVLHSWQVLIFLVGVIVQSFVITLIILLCCADHANFQILGKPVPLWSIINLVKSESWIVRLVHWWLS